MYTDFWNITKRELIKKAQKVIFEDSQEFLQMLFDIAKKRKHIYLSTKGTQKKIQAAPRQITITLFIIIKAIAQEVLKIMHLKTTNFHLYKHKAIISKQ